MMRAGRRKLTLAVLAAAVCALLILFLSSPTEGAAASSGGKPSTFFTDAAGTRAILMVLREFLPSAERWMKPLELLPAPEGGNPMTLLVIGPSRAIGEKEAASLDAWVEKGGQLVIATQQAWHAEPEPGAGLESGEPADYLARHGFSFVPGAEAAFSGRAAEYPDSQSALLLEGGVLERGEYTLRFGSDAVPKGGEKPVGAGRIIVIADKQVWSNRRLSQSRNAVWLVRTALSWGNGRLLFDEYHHGFEKTRGTLALTFSFLASSWGLAFAQLLLAGLLALWMRGARFGPLIEPPPARPPDPLARLDALAGLLETAKAEEFALRNLHQHLLRRLWQLRYGALQPTGHSDIEELVLTRRPRAQKLDRYLSLVRRRKEGPGNEADLVEAARLAGEILEEYRHGKQSTR
jgi:hypothetical protein